MGLLGLLLHCGPPAPTHSGTYVQAPWPAQALRTAQTRSALTSRMGEIAVIEGDNTLVSGTDGQYGLRFDETRNDLGAVSARFVQDIGDPDALLVLFTSFEDRGGGGPAYFVPIFNDTLGTGLGYVDQREAFSVRNLSGIANMKRPSEAPIDAQLALLMHEIAHPHTAYLEAQPSAGSTVTVPLLGRQNAHWHATLHTEGSVLGGHGFVETEPGRFVVAQRNQNLSSLDLYALGLLDPDEVPEFFFIEDPVTESGFAVPSEAQLQVGNVVFGQQRRVGIEQVLAALGPRPRQRGPHRTVFALLIAPGTVATSTSIAAQVESINQLRIGLEDAWPEWTRYRGTLCTKLDGCEVAPPTPAPESCQASQSSMLWWVWLLWPGWARSKK